MLQGATKLNKKEMKSVMGGTSYCDRLQEWAGIYHDHPAMPEGYWDDWADKWERHCSN